MKRFVLPFLALSSLAFTLGAAEPGEPLSTDRHIHGVITSIEPTAITISSEKNAVTGKIDPRRTRITINGKPAKLTDLKLTEHAKAELCLDDVWVSVDAH